MNQINFKQKNQNVLEIAVHGQVLHWAKFVGMRLSLKVLRAFAKFLLPIISACSFVIPGVTLRDYSVQPQTRENTSL